MLLATMSSLLTGGINNINMFEELVAWANKWNVGYTVEEDSIYITIIFNGPDSMKPSFVYSKETGEFLWYGGD